MSDFNQKLEQALTSVYARGETEWDEFVKYATTKDAIFKIKQLFLDSLPREVEVPRGSGIAIELNAARAAGFNYAIQKIKWGITE